ncbi:MAG: GNAT family N-acetyltransferase [Gammaproteobacteria bacterium]|nr:GNAT family N-acetyltransferase [Gammaproteobacteria bacterium]
MNLIIRDATPGDARAIAANNNRMAEETESRSLAEELIGPGVAAFLADASKGRYWVAETDGEIVGQIAVTYEWSDWRNGMLWWIQSVYVSRDHRRKGVYTALYDHVESRAKADAGVAGIRLYVEKDNARAQATYEKLGMRMTNYQIMQTLFERNDKE